MRILGREALASLGAPALEDEPTGARAHASTEAVRASALAFLWLIGPLHGLGFASDLTAFSRAAPDLRRCGSPPAIFFAKCGHAPGWDPEAAPRVFEARL